MTMPARHTSTGAADTCSQCAHRYHFAKPCTGTIGGNPCQCCHPMTDQSPPASPPRHPDQCTECGNGWGTADCKCYRCANCGKIVRREWQFVGSKHDCSKSAVPSSGATTPTPAIAPETIQYAESHRVGFGRESALATALLVLNREVGRLTEELRQANEDKQALIDRVNPARIENLCNRLEKLADRNSRDFGDLRVDALWLRETLSRVRSSLPPTPPKT
jgi:hypothetical protein